MLSSYFSCYPDQIDKSSTFRSVQASHYEFLLGTTHTFYLLIST